MGEVDPEPKKFGDLINADSAVLDSEKDAGYAEEGLMKNAMTIKDIATQWRAFAPMANKSAAEARRALREFVGTQKVTRFYSDNGGELVKAADELGWVHDTSTPYRHATIPERDIRSTKEGARAALIRAGLPPKWWPYAGKLFNFALNITEFEGEELCPWELRHGGHQFWGHRLALGELCHFRPVEPKKKKLPEFAPDAIPGVFLGYFLLPGGRWKGDYLVADLDDFRNGKHVHVQRVKEVVLEEGNPKFPLKGPRDMEVCSVDPALVSGSSPDETLLADDVELPTPPSAPLVDSVSSSTGGENVPREVSFDLDCREHDESHERPAPKDNPEERAEPGGPGDPIPGSSSKSEGPVVPVTGSEFWWKPNERKRYANSSKPEGRIRVLEEIGQVEVGAGGARATPPTLRQTKGRQATRGPLHGCPWESGGQSSHSKGLAIHPPRS